MRAMAVAGWHSAIQSGLERGGHGHGRRGEENKNGRGRGTGTDLHTATMVPPWHGHNWAKRTAERAKKCRFRNSEITAEHRSDQDASRQG